MENIISAWSIVRPQWEDLSYLGINEMLNETVNQKSKDKTPVPNMAAMVLKAILDDAQISGKFIYRHFNSDTEQSREMLHGEEQQL